jgi:hypothetical protein
MGIVYIEQTNFSLPREHGGKNGARRANPSQAIVVLDA